MNNNNFTLNKDNIARFNYEHSRLFHTTNTLYATIEGENLLLVITGSNDIKNVRLSDITFSRSSFTHQSVLTLPLPVEIPGGIWDVDWNALWPLVGLIPILFWYKWYKRTNDNNPMNIHLCIFGEKIRNRLHNMVVDLNDLTGRNLRILFAGHPRVRFMTILIEGQYIEVAYDVDGVNWERNLPHLIRLRDNSLNRPCVRDFPAPDIDRWCNLITHRGLILTSRGINGLVHIYPQPHHGTILVHGNWVTYLSPLLEHLADF